MLKGKVAVITGGTRGIGFGIVKKYLENGAKVVLFGSRKESVDRGVGLLKDENDQWEVEGMYPDLSNPADVENAINNIHAKYGKIDILVNNAGISQSTPLYDYTAEEFDAVIDLNVKSLFYTILPTAILMKAQGGGCIINISSMVSISGQPSGVGYPTSKFAVNGLTISLARELGKDKIRVNAVAPGVIETDMFSGLPDEVKQAVASTIPLGRPGQPTDIANACLYLASDMADYVSGEILSVDGATRI